MNIEEEKSFKMERIYYISEVLGLKGNTLNSIDDIVFYEHKIGDINDLITFLSNYFNVNKEFLNLEFSDGFENKDLIEKINQIKKLYNINIEYYRNFSHDHIKIKLDNIYQLHIKHLYHGSLGASDSFNIQKEFINNENKIELELSILWRYE